jgi:hypothetical protein
MDVKSIIKEEVDNFILTEVEKELQELVNEDYGMPADDASNSPLPQFGDRLRSISEQTYKVYHGTNQKFSNFNFKTATQGIVWFTDSPESIEKGEHGGAGNKIIMTRYITINKPAGWAEYEKYGLGQLEDMGYDGVILPQGDKTDYFVFSPKAISAKEPENIDEADASRKDYLSWKRKNVTLRGISNVGGDNGGFASYGQGLYSAFLGNREMAKQYGNVYFLVNAIPKHPKILNSVNDAEIFLQQVVTNYCKEHGVPRSNQFFSNETTVADEMQRLGYDGLVIRGREMVNYAPPKNVVYFKTEDELERYYDVVINKSSQVMNETPTQKKLYYHGRKMGGRPYSGTYIFITDNLGYASEQT